MSYARRRLGGGLLLALSLGLVPLLVTAAADPASPAPLPPSSAPASAPAPGTSSQPAASGDVTAPSPSPAQITLSPFEDASFGIRAVVPDGWTDQGNGIHSRAAMPGSSDLTLLALQSTPLGVDSLWPTLARQLGLQAAPDPVGTRDTAAFHWTLYHVDVPTPAGTVAVDLALASTPGHTWIALLQTDPTESAALHDGVFLPVVDAFAPLPVPEPSTSADYDSLEVNFPGGAADVMLAGTLTVPHGSGPHPAVVLLSGSGPQDRDETLQGIPLKPFAPIADALTRAGVAVLRFDDRGVGGSSGDFASAATADFTADGQAAVRYLRSREDIDPARVGAIGHSEGGLEVAAMAAADPALAFVVAMAGPAVPGIDLILAQTEAVARSEGTSEADVARISADARPVFEAIRDGRDDEVEPLLATALGDAWDRMTPDQRQQAGSRDAYVRSQSAAQLAQLESPWWRAFLRSDPGADWRQAQVPVLALFGGKDVQVPAAQNAPALASELSGESRALSTIVILPDANHLFQAAETGAPTEYAKLGSTFTPEFLPTLVEWITQRVSAGP